MPLPQDPLVEYQRRLSLAPPCSDGETAAFAVAAEPAVQTTYDAAAGRLHLHYRMFFNDLTEGWNWYPLEAAAGGDYYAFKFLHLASRIEEGASYPVDNGPGLPSRYAVRTRTDYFFAFDNPYDFYPRDAGDDMGFEADIAVSPAEAERLTGQGVRIGLRGTLRPDCLSSSKTYWKATVDAPVDYTLYKRYLIGRLVDIWFYDERTGRVLARLQPLRQ